MRTQGKILWYISSLLNWFEKHLKLVASEILATRLDGSWTYHFQLGLTKVFKFF